MEIFYKFTKLFRLHVLELPIKHRRLFGAMRAMFVGLPGAIVVFVSYTYPTSAGPLGSPYKFLKSIIDTNAWALIILLALSGIFSFLFFSWRSAAEYFSSKYVDSIDNVKKLTTVYGAIEEVVVNKQKRFGDQLQKVIEGHSRLNAADTFNTITKPTDQIKDLIRVAQETIKRLTNIDDIRLVLVEISEDNKLTYAAFAPTDKIPHDDVLNSDSLFKWVIATEDRLVWSDIEAKHTESNRLKMQNRLPAGAPIYYVATNRRAPASIFLYPIRCSYQGHKIVYILSVTSDRKNALTDDICKTIEKQIWSPFEERILLEHCLKELKRYANQP